MEQLEEQQEITVSRLKSIIRRVRWHWRTMEILVMHLS